MYKKSQGTSGIRGQLYETKLISLIHYRTKFDDDIEDYTLASNVPDIGTFDDICIRATVKVKGGNKPVAVFIQAKHREGNNVKLTLNSKCDLAKWFSSYLKIRHLFKPDNKDVMFKGNFQEIECHFIMYTTAKADLNTKEFKSDFADKLNSWIGTGNEGLQPYHKEEDIVFLCESIMKDQFAALAVQLAKFLSVNAKDNEVKDENKNNDGLIMPMSDELMLVYHVILVQKVLDVSEIKCKDEKDEHRVASFQTDFFNNVDKFIILFKNTLFIEMLRNRQLKEAELNTFLLKLFIKPLDITVLSSLIGNVVMFNDEKFKLEFVSKSFPEVLRRQLEKVHVLQSQVNEAIELGAVDMLKQRKFKVPTAFGNKDMTIRGKEDTVEPSVFIASVIDNLKNKLVGLIKASPTENIIVIDESIEKEFLNLNVGLPGTIGNILVSSENPKYLQFTDKDVSGDLASKLYSELQSVIPNLHDYKFHIKVKTFPKHTFDCEDDENLEMLQGQITVLAEHMGQFLCKEDDSILPMNDIMSRYHVLVALKAIKVSEIQSEDNEHRLASFRHEFFESDEEFVILFKRALYKEILKIREFDKNESDWAVKEMLISSQFKVPAAFGNKDIIIKIKKSKTERRLDHLNLKISELITKSGADKIVTIDESLGDGLLKLNGGIAGIVGNLLISEENTNLMKFTDDWESLGELSKKLFMKLKSGIKNLHEYRFNVKVKKFPKLSFKRNEDDENLAKDFLNKLLFFTSQADEQRVEKCLKDEIEDQQCLKVFDVRVTVDAVFQQYHKLIQTWWMLKEASYLTKQSKHYEDALALIVDKPVMSIISLIYMTKIKNYLNYTFNEKSLSHLKLEDQPSATIFVTENSALTVAKMVQSLKRTDHFVFNLEYILDLPARDYKTVTIELTKTKENQLIIIVCNIINIYWSKKLKDIAKLIEKKRSIFVIKKTLEETIQKYFVQANNVVIDEKCSLIQMSKISQKSILENAKVTFQDVELSLESIIDEHSMSFVEGVVLYTAMNNDSINLGETNSNSDYEKVKHLYIDRRVCWPPLSSGWVTKSTYVTSKTKYVLTLNDITDDGDVALVTATPGMGKSTLLTHLSMKTKELKPTVWIVRINLLIHSDKFSRWQENKTNIGYLESLKFFCEVLTEKQRRNNDFSMELEESNGTVTLKSGTGDQWTDFELKMFLDYYNRKEIIFLFDGFDEICPTYMDEVLTLLTTVGINSQKHKMWITTRPYDKILSRLEEKFGRSCKIEYFSDMEQNVYLANFWKSNIKLRHLTKKQCDNLRSFLAFMTTEYIFEDVENQGTYQYLFLTVCFNFLNHLREEINTCPCSVIKNFEKLYSSFDYQVRCYVENFSTPLHLYLFADYFQNRIKDESIIPNRWSLNINAYTVYQSFIETILKRHLQEKNKIDLYNPDNKNIYENVRVEFLAKHKKLGAYAVFERYSDKIFSGKELKEIDDTMDKIKAGTEKSGFIHSVVLGHPNFIHRTFTEYFAAQHICDLLKTLNREDKLKSVWDFILNVVFEFFYNIRDILCYMIKSDLRAIVKDHEQIIFDLLLEQGKEVFTFYADDFRKYLYLNIKTSLLEAMDEGFDRFKSRMYNLIGAITGIVGISLIADNNTKLKKFTDNWESLEELSKRLFIKLQTVIKNMNKFDAKLKKCPKLSFKRNVENSAKDIMKQLIFSTNEADNTGIEKFLKNEIVDNQCAKVDKIKFILQYLNLIKRWWMVSQAKTHKSNIDYERNIRRRTYEITTYSGPVTINPSYKTNKNVLSCLKFKDQPSAKIFVTENTALTVDEIMVSLNCITHYVIDLDHFSSAGRYNKIFTEATETETRELLIIVCNNLEITNIKHLELFEKFLENKRTIFVINETLVETIQTYFLQANKECSLIKMSEKSHKFISESAKVMLEDLEMCLDSIIDEQEEGEGEVLNINPN